MVFTLDCEDQKFPHKNLYAVDIYLFTYLFSLAQINVYIIYLIGGGVWDFTYLTFLEMLIWNIRRDGFVGIFYFKDC